MIKDGKYSTNSFVQLGKNVTFFGKHYTVAGRIRYQGKIEEWDSEEGVFEKYTVTCDEWILRGDKEFDVYLTLEDGEYYFGYAWSVPRGTILPQKPEKYLHIAEKHPEKHRITERGVLEAVFVEGDSDGVAVGFENEYALYLYKKEYFGIEWEIIDPGEQQDVYFFREKVLTKQELFQALGHTERLQEEVTKEKRANEFLRWCKFFYIISGILAVMAFSSMLFSRQIYHAPFSYNPLGEQSQTQEFGPVSMRHVGKVYNVELVANQFSTYSETMTVDVELLDANKRRINAMDGELWKHDGEEWNNGQYSNNYFRLTEAGNYMVRVTVFPSTRSDYGLEVKVHEDVSLARYYLAALALILPVALVFGILGQYKRT